MSTNLSGNILTLGDTNLDESYLKLIKDQYVPTDNCKVGDTVILDGIECLCVATGVTIQGSNLTRIAVDKNHDLGYYQKYVGINQTILKQDQGGVITNQITSWRWGGYGTALGNTSKEVGYGLQNTINCLANTKNYTKGTYSSTASDGFPWLWIGVNDFRSSHSGKWFVPSVNELKDYVYPNKSSLTFDETTGGSSTDEFWSSSEASANTSYYMGFHDGYPGSGRYKHDMIAVRLCRAF